MGHNSSRDSVVAALLLTFGVYVIAHGWLAGLRVLVASHVNYNGVSAHEVLAGTGPISASAQDNVRAYHQPRGLS